MATEMFKLFGSVFVDTEQANKSLHKTESVTQKLGNALLSGVKTAAKFGAAVLAGATAAATGLVALTESTREYRTEQAKLQTAFEAASFSADAAQSTYSSLNAVLGDSGQAVEASAHLAQLCSTEQQLSDWTTIATGVYATFGDSLPIEGLTEAANETAKVGSVTGALADALNWVGLSEDEFNAQLAKCSTEQERAALITETLNGAYSETAEMYREMNGDALAANEAQDKLNSTMATLGSRIEPIVTSGKEFVAEILLKALPYLEMLLPYVDKFKEWLIAVLSDTKSLTAKILELAETAAYATGVFVSFKVAMTIQKTVQGFQEAKVALALLTMQIGSANLTQAALNGTLTVGETIVGLLTGKIKLATLAQGLMTKGQAALNAVISANPITIIITAVAALAAAFIYLWNNCEDFRKFWIDLWEGIKSLFWGAVSWIKENWQSLVLFLINPVAGVFKILYDNCEGFRNFIDNTVASVKGWFSDMWEGIKDGAVEAWQGVQNAFASVADWFENIFSNAWAAVKNVFSAGGEVFSGIKEGIEDTFITVVNAIISGINTVVAIPFNTINGVLNKIRSIKILDYKPFSGLWDKDPLAVPQIPQLYEGGVLEKGQTGYLEGNGAEAVVPLHNNSKWISAVAQDMRSQLGETESSWLKDRLDRIILLLEQLLRMGVYLDGKKVGELLDKYLGAEALRAERLVI